MQWGIVPSLAGLAALLVAGCTHVEANYPRRDSHAVADELPPALKNARLLDAVRRFVPDDPIFDQEPVTVILYSVVRREPCEP
ncbi:MAG: hypothetical protein RBT60_00270 [Candidatus Krumholzibacteria bacterium]|jgi:hypothetical protein|nr:hypothetical protein [Candidatus Krumholzibacteria bacterium]